MREVEGVKRNAERVVGVEEERGVAGECVLAGVDCEDDGVLHTGS